MTGLLGETKKNIVALAQLTEVAFFVGMAYVFYFAPVKVVRGDSSTTDKIAGLVGLLFWMTAAATLSGAIP